MLQTYTFDRRVCVGGIDQQKQVRLWKKLNSRIHASPTLLPIIDLNFDLYALNDYLFTNKTTNDLFPLKILVA